MFPTPTDFVDALEAVCGFAGLIALAIAYIKSEKE